MVRHAAVLRICLFHTVPQLLGVFTCTPAPSSLYSFIQSILYCFGVCTLVPPFLGPPCNLRLQRCCTAVKGARMDEQTTGPTVF